MRHYHLSKQDRILSDDTQRSLSKIYSYVQHALIGAFLAYTIYRLVNIFTDNAYIYFLKTSIEGGFLWIFAGAVLGLAVRKLIPEPKHDTRS